MQVYLCTHYLVKFAFLQTKKFTIHSCTLNILPIFQFLKIHSLASCDFELHTCIIIQVEFIFVFFFSFKKPFERALTGLRALSWLFPAGIILGSAQCLYVVTGIIPGLASYKLRALTYIQYLQPCFLHSFKL